MDRIARFEKVSEKEFNEPELVKLPKRATTGSAGYDFFTPYDIDLAPGESLLVKTGIRCRIEEGWVLLVMPKSGLGYRYRVQLDNTVGVIDADYYFADNEGHIQIKISNDGYEGKTMHIDAGKAFVQGLFVPFGITVDDDAKGERRGGFGSTGS